MSLFSERLNQLFDESNLKSVTSFSSYLGIKRETLTSYLNGKRQPDFNMIIHLCKKLDVSADWLLGLSDVRTLDKSITSVCETLGISETAALTIMNRNRENEFLDTFSLLMETEHIDSIKLGLDYCTNMAITAYSSGEYAEETETPYTITEDVKILLNHTESSKYFASVLAMSLETLLQNDYLRKVYDTLDNMTGEENSNA